MEFPKIKQTGAMREYLSMKIPLRARLSCPLSELAKILSNYPNMHPFSRGTELKYAIDCGSNFYLFTFGPEHIIEEVYSSDSPVYHLTDALVRLMSVVACLGDAYSVRVESIFPYLISALAGRQLEAQIPRPQQRGGSDLILAKRILGIASSLEKLQAENSLMKKERARLLFHLILFESANGPIERKSVLKKYLVDDLAMKDALGISQTFGYRIIAQNSDCFRVVRE